MIENILLNLFIGLAAGSLVTYLAKTLTKKMMLRDAHSDAQEILNDAEEQFQLEEAERNEVLQEVELEAWSKVEEQHLLIEGKCADLEQQIADRKKAHEESDKNQRQNLIKFESELRDQSIKLNDHQKRFQDFLNIFNQTKEDYKKSLAQKTQLKEVDVIQEITQKMLTEAQQDYDNYIQLFEDENKEFAEAKAKRILGLCIDRFTKEMSTERNIASSYFPDEKIRSLFMQNGADNIKAIEEITGCDILIDSQPDPDRI